MRIDRKLNLVFPVDTAIGTVFVHSTPISREVFEQHYLVLGKTFTTLLTNGLSLVQGPNLALLLLRDVAKGTVVPGHGGSAWDEVERGLLPEMRRLTNVMVPNSSGYRTVPFDVATRDGTIDADDAASVESMITFFTVASWGMRGQSKTEIESFHDGMRLLWTAQITSSSCTEYAASLTTSTPEESTQTIRSSQPSSTTQPDQDAPNSSVVIPT